MLEKLKEMQEQGIFSLLPTGIDLNKKIKNATELTQLSAELKSIKNYIKRLDEEFSIKYHVSVATEMSDFYDKIYYNLYETYLKSKNAKTQIHEVEDNYGKAGKFKIGLKLSEDNKTSEDNSFTLEERKLIKLINHYYITLKGEGKIDCDLFYIPMDQIQRLYSKGKNANRLKQSVIETCNKLNSKIIYLDFSTTRYKKKLSDKELETIDGEQLLNIIPIYQIWKEPDKFQLKGLICRVNKFMKLRYELKQIGNNYPTSNLNADYLEFVIADKFQYHLHLIRKSGNKKLKKALSDLTKEIYYYSKGKQQFASYYETITNDTHKPREQNKFLKALLGVLSALKKLNYNVKFEIDGFTIQATTPNGAPREVEHVLTEISKSGEIEQINSINKLCSKLSSDIAPISIRNILEKSKLIPKSKLGEYETKLYKNKKEAEEYKQNSDVVKYNSAVCEYERILEEIKNELIENIYSVGITRNFLNLFKRGEIVIVVEAK